MFIFIADGKSKSPVYDQLYRFIRARIESGDIAAGEKLPSQRKLAAHLKLSRTTVESAYAQLAAEGYITPVQKSGYFAAALEKSVFSVPKKGKPAPTKQAPAQKEYDFDFKTNTVSLSLFPFSSWAGVARGVLGSRHGELLSNTHPQGLPALREEISKYLKNYRGIEANPSRIIIGAGTEYLLGIAVALLGRQGVYAVENPGYGKISAVLKNNGVKIAYVPLDGGGLNLAGLQSSGARVAHITPSHQFPSGIVMPASRRTELLSWAGESADRYIIEDDYDSEFRFSGNPIQALHGLGDGERVIYINSFTKSLAPSMRVSYMLLPERLLGVFNEKYRLVSCSVPSFEQYTLCEFMKRGLFERHLGRMRKAYKEMRDTLIKALSDGPLYSITEIIGQDAGLHFLIKVKNGISEAELVDRAKAAGVRVYGLSEYCPEPAPGLEPSTVVVGYSAMSAEEIEKAVHALESAWAV